MSVEWVAEQFRGCDEIASHERDMCHICSINQRVILEGIIRAGVGGCTSGWMVGPPGEDRSKLHSIVEPGAKAPGIVGMDSEKEKVRRHPG
jgi:hypothetical protein